MPLFRKKPIVIEARYFDGTHHSADHLIDWMSNVGTFIFPKKSGDNGSLYVGTLEDGEEGEAKHVASAGDWVIKGIAGEFYPIKPAIFDATYEHESLLERDGQMTEALDAADATIARLREALTQIAAFRDKFASESLALSGSYSSFDEPGSVEIARAVLTAEAGE